jgi:sec-independent protein translocase protein TatA
MGLGGISPWSLLLILVIILLLFGTKRLRNMGSDLGETFKNFKQSMKSGEEETMATTSEDKQASRCT